MHYNNAHTYKKNQELECCGMGGHDVSTVERPAVQLLLTPTNLINTWVMDDVSRALGAAGC